MRNVKLETFTDSLTQLRQALADADPLAAPPNPPFTATADAVAAAFASAGARDRARFLLRALDDAIAAVEVAARLSDELHGAGNGSQSEEPATDSGDDPLQSAYRAFAESQPAYQALYHYRNALAAALRVHTRPMPDAVRGVADTQAAEASTAGEERASSTKPRKRARKATAAEG